MFDLNELEQFVLFGELGSLSAVADKLQISVPTISRSMQNVEAEFGVPIFNRSRNKLSLNDTGKEAVSYSRHFLGASYGLKNRVRRYAESQNSVTIRSCATAPLWEVLRRISENNPEMKVSYKMFYKDDLDKALFEDDIDIFIVPSGTYEKSDYDNKRIKIKDDKTTEQYNILIKKLDKLQGLIN